MSSYDAALLRWLLQKLPVITPPWLIHVSCKPSAVQPSRALSLFLLWQQLFPPLSSHSVAMKVGIQTLKGQKHFIEVQEADTVSGRERETGSRRQTRATADGCVPLRSLLLVLRVCRFSP